MCVSGLHIPWVFYRLWVLLEVACMELDLLLAEYSSVGVVRYTFDKYVLVLDLLLAEYSSVGVVGYTFDKYVLVLDHLLAEYSSVGVVGYTFDKYVLVLDHLLAEYSSVGVVRYTFDKYVLVLDLLLAEYSSMGVVRYTFDKYVLVLKGRKHLKFALQTEEGMATTLEHLVSHTVQLHKSAITPSLSVIRQEASKVSLRVPAMV